MRGRHGIWASKVPNEVATPDHGSTVTPCGLFPSPLSSLEGSSSAWILKDRIALRITSLAHPCLLCRPALRRQERPWWPSWSTSIPHKQMRGRTRAAPTLRPTATRSSSFPRLKPRFDKGKAWSHEPDDGAEEASSLARATGLACSNSLEESARLVPSSQARWLHASAPYFILILLNTDDDAV